MRPRIGLSVMPLETRHEAIVGLATEGDRLGYDGFSCRRRGPTT
jgi:hypothetical protein